MWLLISLQFFCIPHFIRVSVGAVVVSTPDFDLIIFIVWRAKSTAVNLILFIERQRQREKKRFDYFSSGQSWHLSIWSEKKKIGKKNRSDRIEITTNSSDGIEQKTRTMSAVDEIINYKRSPDEDFYALLHCDEHSNVSEPDFCWFSFSIIVPFHVRFYPSHSDEHE